MRRAYAGSNYRDIKNRYITITSVSSDTMVDHKRHTRRTKKTTYYIRISLRNRVLRYERGRVFPAGIGLDSPSRDVANWMSSQFSRPAETRWWRYGWLRKVFIRCASPGLQFGALRKVVVCERQGVLSRKAWYIG